MASQRRALLVQYTNPAGYPPLQHIADILLGSGWEVAFLGLGGGGTEKLRLREHPRQQVALMPNCPPGWRQKLHYTRFLVWTLWWRITWRPHCVYGSDPLSTPAILLASAVSVDTLIYHEHDAPSSSPSRFMRWIAICRARVARRANAVVVPNAVRGQHLIAETGMDPSYLHCVWNCPTREEAQFTPDARDADSMWLIFHGSIVPERLPLALLDALATQAEAVKLRVIGYETAGSKGYVAQFLQKAQALGLAGRVEYLGAVPLRDDLLSQARRSHIGISFMPMSSTDLNMQHMTGASNKPFDYLACGCALLVSDLPDWDDMFVTPGYGLKCNPQSAQSLGEAIQWYWTHREEAAAMGERGRQSILDWCNYEHAFAGVQSLMERGAGAISPVQPT